MTHILFPWPHIGFQVCSLCKLYPSQPNPIVCFMLMVPSSPIVDEAALGVLLRVILEGQWEVSNPPTRFSYSRMAFSGHFS